MGVKKGMMSSGSSNDIYKPRFLASRRGQVTVFIIIGIVVVFITAGILFITQKTSKSTLDSELEPTIALVPQEFRPIQLYVDDCLLQVGKQGLDLLGEQGGYIDPGLVGKYSSLDPTNSDGIDLEPMQVPYWHYNINQNGAEIRFASLQPALHSSDDPEMSIEAQLARFTQQHLDECLRDFTVFSIEGFTVEHSADERKIAVRVADRTVNFDLKTDVVASRGEESVQMDRFFVKLELPFKEYYEVASGIAKTQRNTSFLETAGIELLEIYGQTDIEKIPPTSAVTFEPVSVNSWDVTNVEDRITGMLSSNIPLLRYLGSANFYRHEYPVSDLSALYQKTYDNTIIPLSDNFEGTEISFDYFNWNPYLNVNGGEQEIAPDAYFIKSPLPVIPFSFSWQRYYTTYDLSFPALVTVSDPHAFDGEGYALRFALEANIINNDYPEESVPQAPVVRANKESQVCDKDKHNTELIRTVVVDSYTHDPIDLVQVGFTVPEQDTCIMGTTDTFGELETNYPAVYGGMVEFIHTDYLTNFYPVDTYQYKEEQGLIGYAAASVNPDLPQRVVELDKIVEVPVVIKKKEVGKCVQPLECSYTYSDPALLGGGFTFGLPYSEIECTKAAERCFVNGGSSLFDSELGEPVFTQFANGSLSFQHNYYFSDASKDLEDTETALVSLERVANINPLVVSDSFSTAVNVVGNEVKDVPLVPGIYKVRGTLIRNEQLVIPDDDRCRWSDILGFDTQDCNKVSGTDMSAVPTGVLKWETPETYITITPQDLYSAQQIELYVLGYDVYGAPETFTATAKECAGYTCLEGVGCLFEACSEEEAQIPGRVLEDLGVTSELGAISQREDVRASLEPVFR